MSLWTNKNKTKWLDIDSVTYWEYHCKKPPVIQDMSTKEAHIQGVLMEGASIALLSNGYLLRFSNEEAEEIYQLLVTKKQLLGS